MPCNGDCNQGRECNCDLDAKRIAELEAKIVELHEMLRQSFISEEETDKKLDIAIKALEVYSASKKVGLFATIALTKIKGE